MDKNWDTEDVEPVVTGGVDKWDDEDADDVKDNWDDESEDDEGTSCKNATTKPTLSMAERIKLREEKKKKIMEERKLQEEMTNKTLTPEEQTARNLRILQEQKESDLMVAVETFGVSDIPSTTDGLESMNPSSIDDFTIFERRIITKISSFSKSPHYPIFVSKLCKELAGSLTEPDEVKDICTTLNAVLNEKIKLMQKKKKKNKAAKIIVDRSAAVDATTFDDAFDEYDDFM